MAEPFDEHEPWLNYARAAWDRAGSPAGLDPADVLRDPLGYDEAYYAWFEDRYADVFRPLYRRLAAGGEFMGRQPSWFVASWRTWYDPITVWKQLLPFFVVARALGGTQSRHVPLAAAYAVGQAIPSMVVDRLLDEPSRQPAAGQEVVLFCLTAYALGLTEIRRAAAPAAVEQRFLDYTQEMYHRMWAEEHARFRLPDAVSAADLDRFIREESRLLSSVFFGATVEWAFALAGQPLPAAFVPALAALRKVRQLNDELVDVDDDVARGIVSYPCLNGLAHDRVGRPLAENLRASWAAVHAGSDVDRWQGLAGQRRRLLEEAGSYGATAACSLGLLRVARDAVRDYFAAQDAFDVSLMLNIRQAHLSRLARNNWREIPKERIRQPRPPLDGPAG